MILVLVGLAVLPQPAAADPSGIIERERQRRAENIRSAREALEEGDRAYLVADYAKAVKDYTEAHSLLPHSPQTSALLEAATERLAKAAVERARQLAKIGEREAADSLLQTVLAPGVAPNYAPAIQMREKIQDPIRYNPALTPEHVRDIDKVRRYLYEAQGFADLGQYDRAVTVYHAVLRIDPYNVAARRGMEAVTRLKQEYYRAASDEARAAFLAEVDGAWETKVPPPTLDLDAGFGVIRDPGLLGGASPEEKLSSIIVPVVDLDQVDLQEAIDFLRQQSIALDTAELVPERRGLAFVVELGTGDPARTREIEQIRFNLKLRNVPLEKILDYIMDATRTTYRLDQHAVVIRPAGAVGDDLVTRQFRVPPDFLSREALGGGGGGGNADPFADDAPARGLVRRLTAQEFLKNQGVLFPPGSGATFSPANSVLSVRNTLTNMRLVEVIIESIAEAEPIMIVVEARFIRSTQKVLEELGFDWLIGTPRIERTELFLGGGTAGNGTGFGGPPGVRPITAGNRSGTLATETSSIDSAIAGRGADSAARAPGILQANGLVDNQFLGALMRGLNQKTGIDLLTKKSVVTRSGQAATIHSVREFIYPTEYEPPELPNSVGGGGFIDLVNGQVGGDQGTTPVTPAHPTAFETTNLGCTMEVLPQIGEDGRTVEVSIKPEIRRFDGFIDYGSPIRGSGGATAVAGVFGAAGTGNFGNITENNILMPVISTVRGNTTLTILDGETVIMGGLLSNSRIKVEDQTPILGSLPLLGRLFETNAYTSVKEAYVILVTVRLQDPAGESVNSR